MRNGYSTLLRAVLSRVFADFPKQIWRKMLFTALRTPFSPFFRPREAREKNVLDKTSLLRYNVVKSISVTRKTMMGINRKVAYVKRAGGRCKPVEALVRELLPELRRQTRMSSSLRRMTP